MRRLVLCCCVLALALVQSLPAAEDLVINYQGRIRSKGKAFDGQGQFKIAIVTKGEGEQIETLWLNDGDASSAVVPVEPVLVDVVDGYFSLDVGDTSIANMAALNPVLFNVKTPLFWRTWFSNGVDGFEQLTPDRRITDPQVLGMHQTQSIDLYVNAATGQDFYSGLFAARPKKTLGAALSAIPALMTKPVTIHVSPGAYPEILDLKNLQMISGEASLTIVGNSADASTTRITGAASATGTVADKSVTVKLYNVTGLTFDGLQFDYCKDYPISANRSDFAVKNCIFKDNDGGMSLNKGSLASVSGSTFSAMHWGIYSQNSEFSSSNCTFNDLTNLAITGAANSKISVSGCNLQHCGQGIKVEYSSSGFISNTTLNDIYASAGHALEACQGSSMQVQNCQITNVRNCGVIAWNNCTIELATSTISQCNQGGYDWYAVQAEANSHMRILPPTTITQTGTTGGVRSARNSYIRFHHIGGKTTVSNNPTGLRAEYAGSIENMNSTALTLSGNTLDKSSASGGNLFNIP